MTKLTYKNAINYVMEHYDLPTDINDKLQELSNSLNRKSSGKETKAQKENSRIAEEIYSKMEAETAYRTKDIKKLLPELADFSSQKITSLMRLLSDRVDKEIDKEKKAVYMVK